MWLAIDPGIDTGWAYFDSKLYACGLGEPREYWGWGRLVIERPQIYPRTSTKQANDLITLAIRVGGYIREHGKDDGEPLLVLPHTWKGNVPKDIHHARVWSVLTSAEKNLAERALKEVAPTKRHNMLDAIGLGLYALNRLRP